MTLTRQISYIVIQKAMHPTTCKRHGLVWQQRPVGDLPIQSPNTALSFSFLGRLREGTSNFTRLLHRGKGHQFETLSSHSMLTASVGLRITHSAQQRHTAKRQKNGSHVQHGWLTNPPSFTEAGQNHVTPTTTSFLYVMAARGIAPAGPVGPEILPSAPE